MNQKNTFDINKYTIKKTLGSGGFGSVYLAYDTISNRNVALKKLIKPTPESIKRFEEEQKIIAHLDHPGIVKLHDGGIYQQDYYLDMEYIQGITLAEYVKKNKKLSSKEACNITLQILDAVKYIHSQHIIHRDIKPENVLLDQNKKIHLIDFGILKDLNDPKRTRPENLAYTPHYTPHERLDPTIQDSPQTDIFAIGATLYHLLTGKTPYGRVGNYFAPHKSAKIDSPRKYNISIPENLANICLKSLDASLQVRYQSCNEFKRDITNFLKGKKVIANTYSSKFKSYCYRNYKPLLLTTCTSLVISGSLVAYAYLNFIDIKLDTALETSYRQEEKVETTLAKESKVLDTLKALQKLLDALTSEFSKDIKSSRLPEYLNTPQKIDTYFNKLQTILTNNDSSLYAAWTYCYLELARTAPDRKKNVTYQEKVLALLDNRLNSSPDDSLAELGYMVGVNIGGHYDLETRRKFVKYLSDNERFKYPLIKKATELVDKCLTGYYDNDQHKYQTTLQKAEKILEEVLHHWPHSFIAYEQLVQISHKKRDYFAMENYVIRALKIQPRFTSGLHLLIDLHLPHNIRQFSVHDQLNNARKMLPYINHSLTYCPQETSKYSYLGIAHLILGDHETNSKKKEKYYLDGIKKLKQHKYVTYDIKNRNMYYLVLIELCHKAEQDDEILEAASRAQKEIEKYKNDYIDFETEVKMKEINNPDYRAVALIDAPFCSTIYQNKAAIEIKFNMTDVALQTYKEAEEFFTKANKTLFKDEITIYSSLYKRLSSIK